MVSWFDEIQATRSRDGYYAIEVLLCALNDKGILLNSVKFDGDLSSTDILGTENDPVKMLIGTRSQHYVVIYAYHDHAIVSST